MLASRLPDVANHAQVWERRPTNARNPRPMGPTTRTAVISDEFWRAFWNNEEALSANTERLTPSSPLICTLLQLFAEVLGSNTNPANLMLPDEAVHGAKGDIEGFKRHMSDARMRINIRAVPANDRAAATLIIESLQEVSASSSLQHAYFQLTTKRLKRCLLT
jgi:hypothetical protein